jgi:hypothetical protein
MRWISTPTAAVAGACALVVALAGGSSASTSYHLVLKSQRAIAFTHNQGVARVPDGWILTGTDKPLVGTDNIVRKRDDGTTVRAVTGAIPPQLRAQGYDHIGDIDVVGHIIYAPLEQPHYGMGVQVTAMYDARTLLFLGSVQLHQHQNSFVTIDPATMTAYTMDGFDGDSLLRYDVRHGWTPLAPLVMSKTLYHTQGADIARGAIWLSTSDAQNRIYRIDLQTGHVDLLGTHGHPGGEGEGIDATALPSGDLHTLILDPNQRHVWFEHFAVLNY